MTANADRTQQGWIQTAPSAYCEETRSEFAATSRTFHVFGLWGETRAAAFPLEVSFFPLGGRMARGRGWGFSSDFQSVRNRTTYPETLQARVATAVAAPQRPKTETIHHDGREFVRVHESRRGGQSGNNRETRQNETARRTAPSRFFLRSVSRCLALNVFIMMTEHKAQRSSR